MKSFSTLAFSSCFSLVSAEDEKKNPMSTTPKAKQEEKVAQPTNRAVSEPLGDRDPLERPRKAIAPASAREVTCFARGGKTSK